MKLTARLQDLVGLQVIELPTSGSPPSKLGNAKVCCSAHGVQKSLLREVFKGKSRCGRVRKRRSHACGRDCEPISNAYYTFFEVALHLQLNNLSKTLSTLPISTAQKFMLLANSDLICAGQKVADHADTARIFG